MTNMLKGLVAVAAAILIPLPGPPALNLEGDLAKASVQRPGANRPRPPRGGNPQVRNHGHSNINHHPQRPPGGHHAHNSNADRHHDHGHHDHHRHDRDWNDHWHPVATAVAVTATAAVIGSIVRSIPPNCQTIIVNGYSYYQCGSTWYQPRYAGSDVTYVVVNNPR